MKSILKIISLYVFAFCLLPSSVLGQSQREFSYAEGDTTYIMKRYVFMLLQTGDYKEKDSVKAEASQKGHLAHLNKMAETGKLIAAGPFEEGGNNQGLLIFDVETIADAEKLEGEDPRVKNRELKMETFYWWAAKGTTLK
jgi:uncharacterized protein YciI